MRILPVLSRRRRQPCWSSLVRVQVLRGAIIIIESVVIVLTVMIPIPIIPLPNDNDNGNKLSGTSKPGLSFGLLLHSSTPLYWVAVKDLTLSYYNAGNSMIY